MFMLMQVFNPPIFPSPKPPKWHATNPFWGGIGLCIAFVALGFAMTGRAALAHIFFAAAWPCGSLSLWIFCSGVFRRKRIPAWILTSILLGITLAGTDFVAFHP